MGKNILFWIYIIFVEWSIGLAKDYFGDFNVLFLLLIFHSHKILYFCILYNK